MTQNNEDYFVYYDKPHVDFHRCLRKENETLEEFGRRAALIGGDNTTLYYGGEKYVVYKNDDTMFFIRKIGD